MGEVSSVGDVLELAISREIQAAEFFMDMAGRMASPAMRALFERLSEEELEHKAKLELEMMKEGIVAKTVGRLIDVGEADYGREFDLGPDVDFKEVLSVVIEKERRSFRFYTCLAGIIIEEDVHDVLLQLAEEEARHFVRFEREYDKLTAQER
jgi:rubrerythrin